MESLVASFRFRRLEQSDARTLFDWRNSDRVRKFMYNDRLIDWETHLGWVAQKISSSQDQIFVTSHGETEIGVIIFSEIDTVNRRCKWAFYIGSESSAPGSGSVMEWHAIDYAFNTLALNKLACEVLASNERVIRLHNRFGFVEEGVLRQHIWRDGQTIDTVLLAAFAADWQACRDKLFADLVARQKVPG